jgi:hypothetical protein
MRSFMMAALAVCFAVPAFGQNYQKQCAPKQVIIGQLAAKYGEVRQSQGLTKKGTIIAVFSSSETGTWTITVTAPTGLMCLLS